MRIRVRCPIVPTPIDVDLSADSQPSLGRLRAAFLCELARLLVVNHGHTPPEASASAVNESNTALSGLSSEDLSRPAVVAAEVVRWSGDSHAAQIDGAREPARSSGNAASPVHAGTFPTVDVRFVYNGEVLPCPMPQAFVGGRWRALGASTDRTLASLGMQSGDNVHAVVKIVPLPPAITNEQSTTTADGAEGELEGRRETLLPSFGTGRRRGASLQNGAAAVRGGFDRLVEMGFSTAEIDDMRRRFRSSFQQPASGQAAVDAEDSWVDEATGGSAGGTRQQQYNAPSRVQTTRARLLPSLSFTEEVMVAFVFGFLFAPIALVGLLVLPSEGQLEEWRVLGKLPFDTNQHLVWSVNTAKKVGVLLGVGCNVIFALVYNIVGAVSSDEG